MDNNNYNQNSTRTSMYPDMNNMQNSAWDADLPPLDDGSGSVSKYNNQQSFNNQINNNQINNSQVNNNQVNNTSGSPYGTGYYQGTNQSPYNGGYYNRQGSYGNATYGVNSTNSDNSYEINSAYYDNVTRAKKEKRTMILAFSALIALVAIGIFGYNLLRDIIDSNSKRASSDIEARIEEKYDVSIRLGADVDTTQNGFTIDILQDNKKTEIALERVEKILDRLPEGFLEELMSNLNVTRKLEINITGHMNGGTGDRAVAGLTYYDTTKDVIRLDADVYDWDEFDRTVAHELFHVIDFETYELIEDNTNIRKYKTLNPAGFTYSYSAGQETDYTNTSTNKSVVYFVSCYSKEGVFEDRAEVFSGILATDENRKLPSAYNSIKVQQKVDYIINELDKAFETVDDNSYWCRWK